MLRRQRQVLRTLKDLNLTRASVSLAIIKEYKRNRDSHYNLQYVPIDQKLERRLRNIIIGHINRSNTVEEYSYDCPEPEEDLVRSINHDETDFYGIFDQLGDLNPEEDIIEDMDDLLKAKAYIIVLRNRSGIQVVV